MKSLGVTDIGIACAISIWVSPTLTRDHFGENLVREPVDQLLSNRDRGTIHTAHRHSGCARVKLVVALLFPRAVFGGFPGCIRPASHDNLINVS